MEKKNLVIFLFVIVCELLLGFCFFCQKNIYIFRMLFFKFRQVYSYSFIKEIVGEVLEFIEIFVFKENFKNYIRFDGYNMEEIEELLELRRKDLVKIDCLVIVVGIF